MSQYNTKFIVTPIHGSSFSIPRTVAHSTTDVLTLCQDYLTEAVCVDWLQVLAVEEFDASDDDYFYFSSVLLSVSVPYNESVIAGAASKVLEDVGVERLEEVDLQVNPQKLHANVMPE